MSRTANSIKNIKYSVIGQLLFIITNFIARSFFIKILNAEYLGLNGLFSNILSILSFAELGIGPAIVYSMYKPLAEKNEELLKGLMNLYKKAYVTIGLLILFVGASLTPFLDFFIKEIPSINNVELIYLLYVISTASIYFFSYKRSLLVADQKKYIDSAYHYSFLVIKNICQVIVLLLTKNFILYLVLEIIISLFENVYISLRIDKLYPFLKSKNEAFIGDEVKSDIIKNTKAMIFHKFGSVIVNTTDNLLISKFVGIIEVGLYSNYLLISNALKQLFSILFQSIIASIGHLGATESSEKNEFIFKCVDLLGLWIYGFSSIALLSLFNPFIEIWLGERYLFPLNVVLLIVINFYLTGRRKSVLTFKDALGLFWYDRHKPIFEAVINLILSLILVGSLGIRGVILGTIISTLTTSFWIEPYVVHKFGLKVSVKPYFLKYLFGSGIFIILGMLNLWLINFIEGSSLTTFIEKVLVTAFVPNVLFIIIFWRTKEFQYLLNIIKPYFKKIYYKK